MTPARPTVDVDGLAELLAAATPGPWEVVWNAVAYVDTIADPNDLTGQTPMQQPVKVADAGEADRELIAAMRNALPDLLAHLAAVTAERDEAQRHLAYHLRDFRPGADMKATGDLAVDMAHFAERMRAERDEARAALVGARDDIKARIVTFRDLSADGQYMNALSDAWGLVANRVRAALDHVPTTEGGEG